MNKPINQDIENYKDDFWKGLSLRECMYGGAALIAGIVVIGGAYYLLGIPLIAAIYLAIPVVFPLGLTGFWKSKNGMTLPNYIKRLLEIRYSQPYVYKSQIKDCLFQDNGLVGYIPIETEFLPKVESERKIENETK